MATTTYHGQLAKVDSSGNVSVLYPKTFSQDVYVDSNKKTLQTFLGSTDISSIGNGTITGAISQLNNESIVLVKACYDTTTAKYAHAVNDIIFINGAFKKVTSAITVGTTINSSNTTNANLEEGTEVFIEKLPNDTNTSTYNAIYLANSNNGGVEYSDTTSVVFEKLYDICTKTTSIVDTSDTVTTITSSSTEFSISMITTVTETSDTVTTIVSTISDTSNAIRYIKTVIITTVSDTQTSIVQTYTTESIS